MTTYERIGKASDKMGETNDCAVVAVAAVCNVPYEYAHSLFKKHGRRNRGSTKATMISAVLKDMQVWPELIRPKAKTVKSLKYCLPEKGRFLVWTSRHILACVNGEIIDWTEGRLHRITKMHRISF